MAGRLGDNIAHFARALREAGLPIGPGAVLDAVEAVHAARIGTKQDFFWTLHAVFVKKHEHTAVFTQAFGLFWKRRALIEKIIATLSPHAPAAPPEDKKPEAGALRAAQALLKQSRSEEIKDEQIEFNAQLTMSEREILQRKDFAQMTADEVRTARRLIDALAMPDDWVDTRRFRADPRGSRIDARRTLRSALRAGGHALRLERRERGLVHPPVVAICDISGSMAEYTRVFLHFLHALTDKRRHVETFLFGTRLTNVTRALRRRDPDEALARCSEEVKDWAGGTRISTSLHRFNVDWSRRVLTQGAIVLLFTDGLERDGTTELGREMDRLHRSCRKLVWLNPLLRWDGFAAKAEGIRAMLPHVDEFRPIHNLNAMKTLVDALSAKPSQATDPRLWLRQAS